MGGVAEVATGAGVHGGDEHEVGGVVGADGGARDGDLAVFEGLAEGLEDGARVFGELVEEEDAVVGEGDFARGGFGAATDDGDGRGGVVRGAEGAGADDAVAEAGEGVDLGDLDLFGGSEGREQGEGGAGEEGLAGAGWAGDEEVVVAGDSDDEGALGGGLAADLGEGKGVGPCFGIFYNTWLGAGEGLLVLEVADELTEVAGADQLDAGDEGGLGEVVEGEINRGEAEVAGGFDDVDDAADGAEVAVQGEFPDEGGAFNLGGVDLFGEEEEGEGDGEIEVGAVFTEVGGGEVDGDLLV